MQILDFKYFALKPEIKGSKWQMPTVVSWSSTTAVLGEFQPDQCNDTWYKIYSDKEVGSPSGGTLSNKCKCGFISKK